MMLQRVTFSTVASEDLKKAGVKRKRLIFEPAKVTELTNGLTTNGEAEIADLHSQIKKIYPRVKMDVRLTLITFAFGRVNEYLLVARTRFPHDSRRNTARVGGDFLN
jgi:hypothetical protein